MITRQHWLWHDLYQVYSGAAVSLGLQGCVKDGCCGRGAVQGHVRSECRPRQGAGCSVTPFRRCRAPCPTAPHALDSRRPLANLCHRMRSAPRHSHSHSAAPRPQRLTAPPARLLATAAAATAAASAPACVRPAAAAARAAAAPPRPAGPSGRRRRRPCRRPRAARPALRAQAGEGLVGARTGKGLCGAMPAACTWGLHGSWLVGGPCAPPQPTNHQLTNHPLPHLQAAPVPLGTAPAAEPPGCRPRGVGWGGVAAEVGQRSASLPSPSSPPPSQSLYRTCSPVTYAFSWHSPLAPCVPGPCAANAGTRSRSGGGERRAAAEGGAPRHPCVRPCAERPSLPAHTDIRHAATR
jgi:hypothetical protein